MSYLLSKKHRSLLLLKISRFNSNLNIMSYLLSKKHHSLLLLKISRSNNNPSNPNNRCKRKQLRMHTSIKTS